MLEKQRASDGSINYCNMYGYDAVTSGYQMIAILLRSRQLGVLCNLEGQTYHDLYATLANNFDKKVKKLEKVLSIVLNHFQLKEAELFAALASHQASNFKGATSGLSGLSGFPMQKDKDNVEATCKRHKWHKQEMFKFLTEPTPRCGETRETLSNLIQHPLFLALNKINIRETWILSPRSKKSTLFNVFSSILIIKDLLKFFFLINNNLFLKTELSNRELFKKCLMIEVYGGKAEGRLKGFQQFFLEIARDKGIAITPKRSWEFAALGRYLERFFTFFKLSLPELDKLDAIGAFVAKNPNGISIKNKDFNIILKPLKMSAKTRLRVTPRVGKPYRLTISKASFAGDSLLTTKPVIDRRKLLSLFKPNFIHSMDAMIVHEIMKRYCIILALLGPKSTFALVTTHDNFSVGRLAFVYLDLLIRDAYIEVYNYNYLTTLRENVNEEEFRKFLSETLNTGEVASTGATGEVACLNSTFSNPNMIKYG